MHGKNLLKFSGRIIYILMVFMLHFKNSNQRILLKFKSLCSLHLGDFQGLEFGFCIFHRDSKLIKTLM